MPDQRPQIVRTEDGKLNLIRPAPKIENLVLRGGGVKGIGNPPALIEMDKRGMLSGLNNIVGTSAGALTALCLASGSTPEQFQKLSDDTPLMSLTGKPKNWEKLYPMMKFGVKGFNAVNALQVADHASSTNVSTYLNDNWDKQEFQDKLKDLSVDERNRLQALRSTDLSGNRTGKMVTFKDLDMLHKLDSSKFKTLTLTGFDDKNGKTFYFNAKDYPDMPIAIAGRISMSIPHAFASVNYDPGDGLGRRHFVDGGVGSNMPSEVVTRTVASDPTTELSGRERENVLVKTGIMTFDEGGADEYEKTLNDVVKKEKAKLEGPKPEKTGLFSKIFQRKQEEPKVAPLKGAYKAMHGSPEENTIGDSNILVQAIVGNNMGATDRWDQQKMMESASNCFVIAHGELGTGSFTAGQEKIDMAKQKATELMNEQLDQREDQAYAQKFDSVDEIFSELSQNDKEALLNGPIPDPTTYPLGVKDPNFEAEMDLYNKVVKERNDNALSQKQDNSVKQTSVRDMLNKPKEGQVIGRDRSLTVTEDETSESVSTKLNRSRSNAISEDVSAPKISKHRM
jgi:predicted acylesterase/phospholipase RssA